MHARRFKDRAVSVMEEHCGRMIRCEETLGGYESLDHQGDVVDQRSGQVNPPPPLIILAL